MSWNGSRPPNWPPYLGNDQIAAIPPLPRDDRAWVATGARVPASVRLHWPPFPASRNCCAHDWAYRPPRANSSAWLPDSRMRPCPIT